MFEPGQVVGHYRLDRTVHRGHSTVVFAATDLSSGQQVALKMLADEYATDPAMRERFVTEAQLAAQLDSHPSIATVLRWGQAGDSMYFVTEYIDGVSLSEVLRRQAARGPLPTAEVLDVLQQVADALDFANKRGVLHRNLKPDNVMVRLDGSTRTAYVVDFGITKSSDGSTRGATGLFVGTANYASPEQISGTPPLDRRADVYSFGCLAFELFAGRPPYGSAPNDAARIAAHLQAPIPSLHALRPDLPDTVDLVFAKALAKDRTRRHQRCGDVVKELRAALAGAGARQRSGSFAPPSGGAAPLPIPGPPGVSPSRKRRWPLPVAAAVAVLLLGAVGAAMAVGGGSVSGDVSRGVTPPTTTTTTVPPTTTTTTTTTSTTTTTTTTTSTTTTTIPIGAFGVPVGAEVTAAQGPESAYALAVQQRANPAATAAPGSAAWYYAEWLRTSVPGASGPVTATASGFRVDADQPVELRDFVVTGGLVTDFTECVGDTCTPLSSQVILTAECMPAPGCGSVASSSGDVIAFQRATLVLRWPEQVLFFELVPDEGVTRTIVDVAEPNDAVHYDPETRSLVAVFPDTPPAGTEDRLVVRYDQGDPDAIEIHYG
jgi:serine/threonine-protein kinase